MLLRFFILFVQALCCSYIFGVWQQSLPAGLFMMTTLMFFSSLLNYYTVQSKHTEDYGRMSNGAKAISDWEI